MIKLNCSTIVDIEVRTVSWANGKAQKCQAIARVKDGKGETIKTFLGDPRGNKHFALTSLVSECELIAAAARRVNEEVALMQLG